MDRKPNCKKTTNTNTDTDTEVNVFQLQKETNKQALTLTEILLIAIITAMAIITVAYLVYQYKKHNRQEHTQSIYYSNDTPTTMRTENKPTTSHPTNGEQDNEDAVMMASIRALVNRAN